MTVATQARFVAPDSADAVAISAVIVNWNTSDLLQRCLESLRDYVAGHYAVEAVVVDNASKDDSVELVRRNWPDVRLIVNDENLGYQRANNLGMRASRGAHLLLINADAFATPGAVDALMARMAADPRIGIVGPRLVYGDGTFQRWTAGREPSLRAAIAFYWFLERIPGRERSGLWLGADVREPFECDWVSSACMLVRASMLDDTGYMDERYFAYMDDVDLCHKARAAGWKVWYEPTVDVVHLMGQSTKRQTGAASPLAVTTFHRYFERAHGRRSRRALQAVEASGFGVRALLYGAAGIVKRDAESRELARAHWRNVKTSLALRSERPASKGLRLGSRGRSAPNQENRA